MIKKSLLTALSAVILLGCASDSSPGQEAPNPQSPAAPPADVSLGTAFFGLTIKDCYASAAECFEGVTDPATWASDTVACHEQLRGCFGDLVEGALSAVEQGVGEVAQCGHDGLACFAEAREFDAVVGCRESVETCVDGTVKDLTGIELPTTKEILDAAVEVNHTVIAVNVEAAESAVDTAVTVTDIAAGAVEGAVEGAAGVVEGAVGAAVDVVGGVAASADLLLQCAVQAHDCMWDSGDFFACSDAYQACVLDVQ